MARQIANCTNCGGSSFYSHQFPSGETWLSPLFFNFKTFTRRMVQSEICTDCGHIIFFIPDKDLPELRELDESKKKWRK
ncbi:hypothetical protein SAMN05421753_11979 [Planctomicrobium piriforme]|uniref:Uncharacterized protein n=1 Tax=Planctomicrobium piriforme TaxID=1576369 RepID=A0A1I3QWN1_9PLAN|nr:hypothetical protein SAMN05421753_11979 [Planctomicrobium piriforme]